LLCFPPAFTLISFLSFNSLLAISIILDSIS
jgi:hypothetical protein